MQTVTVDDILKACRAFANENRLGIQNNKTECLYLYGDGCRCSIGAVMTDETLKRIEETSRNDAKIVAIEDFFVISAGVMDSKELQSSHDAVINARHRGDSKETIGRLSAQFFSLLEDLEKRHGIKEA